MASELRVGDLFCDNLVPRNFSPPNDCLGNEAIDPADPIATNNIKWYKDCIYGDPFATTAATLRRVIHIARAAGVVRQFRAGVTTANIGAATITVNLLKNGTTILTGTFNLSSSQAAFITVDGTLVASPGDAYVAGDVFEISISATAGGGTIGKGFFAQMLANEIYV